MVPTFRGNPSFSNRSATMKANSTIAPRSGQSYGPSTGFVPERPARGQSAFAEILAQAEAVQDAVTLSAGRAVPRRGGASGLIQGAWAMLLGPISWNWRILRGARPRAHSVLGKGGERAGAFGARQIR